MNGRRALRQDAILQFLVIYIEEHRFPPTLREITQATGASSTSVVQRDLLDMEALGIISRSPGKARSIRVQ